MHFKGPGVLIAFGCSLLIVAGCQTGVDAPSAPQPTTPGVVAPTPYRAALDELPEDFPEEFEGDSSIHEEDIGSLDIYLIAHAAASVTAMNSQGYKHFLASGGIDVTGSWVLTHAAVSNAKTSHELKRDGVTTLDQSEHSCWGGTSCEVDPWDIEVDCLNHSAASHVVTSGKTWWAKVWAPLTTGDVADASCKKVISIPPPSGSGDSFDDNCDIVPRADGGNSAALFDWRCDYDARAYCDDFIYGLLG